MYSMAGLSLESSELVEFKNVASQNMETAIELSVWPGIVEGSFKAWTRLSKCNKVADIYTTGALSVLINGWHDTISLWGVYSEED